MNSRKQLLDKMASELAGESRAYFEFLVKEYLDDIKRESDDYDDFLNEQLSEEDAIKYVKLIRDVTGGYHGLS